MPDKMLPPTSAHDADALDVVRIPTFDDLFAMCPAPTEEQILGMVAAWMAARPTAWEVSRLKRDISLVLARRPDAFRFIGFWLDSSSRS